jgi:two-component system LytT family response regulator
MTLVEELHPEVIFLDVQMSPLDGFQLVNRLSLRDSAPKIVFVTAYDKFALRAFDANALDYLTKPVLPARLAKTIARLNSDRVPKPSGMIEIDPAERPSIASAGSPETSSKDALKVAHRESTASPEEVQVLRDGGKVRIVRSGEIHSVRAEGNYTRLQLAGGGTLMVRRPIAVWEASLPSEIFLKISKSLLINRSSIRAIDRISRDVTHLRLTDSPDPILMGRLEGQRLSKALARRMNKE